MQIFDYLKTLNDTVVAVEPHLAPCKAEGIVEIGEAIAIADLIVILVAHHDFREFKSLIEKKKVLDFCGLMN